MEENEFEFLFYIKRKLILVLNVIGKIVIFLKKNIFMVLGLLNNYLKMY